MTAAAAAAMTPPAVETTDHVVETADVTNAAAGRRNAAAVAAAAVMGASTFSAAADAAEASGASSSAQSPPAALSARRQVLKSGDRLKSHVRRIERRTCLVPECGAGTHHWSNMDVYCHEVQCTRLLGDNSCSLPLPECASPASRTRPRQAHESS